MRNAKGHTGERMRMKSQEEKMGVKRDTQGLI
jgi:hypothetical protein